MKLEDGKESVKQIKLELLHDLYKQRESLHKAKLNIYVTIDNQKRKIEN